MLCAMTQGAWAQDEETVVNAYFTTDEMPDMMTFVVNTDHPLIKRVTEEGEAATAEALKPIEAEIKGLTARKDAINQSNKDKKYDEYEFDLEKNGAIFLYTDGVAEATNTKDELFGTSRIVDALNNAPDASPKEILDMVNKEVDKFVGDAAQFDDLTMLCIKNK